MQTMVQTVHPLRERLVLFWHGHFTSGYRDVRNTYHMFVQNTLFRRHAAGSFRTLLHAISKDPAMLEYLDNRSNRKEHPNENYAREVMELFTLGAGNYTEEDIREAWGKNRLNSICYIGLPWAYTSSAQSPTTGDQ